MLNLTEVLMACSLLSMITKSCSRILESKFLAHKLLVEVDQ